MKLFLAIISVLIIVGTGFYVWDHTKKVCEMRDGKWGSVQSECITRNCHSTNTCGDWTYPALWCKNLKLGDDISEVYFQLGTPTSIQGNTYVWPIGKGESGKIEATIKDKRLTSLNCNATNK